MCAALLGKPYWPLAERLKLQFGASVRYIEQFEQLAAPSRAAQGYDGVVCGHIHRANLRHIDGTLYGNSGDWVETCSALIESEHGELQLLRWPNAAAALRHRRAACSPSRREDRADRRGRSVPVFRACRVRAPALPVPARGRRAGVTGVLHPDCRSSAMIAPVVARRQTSEAGDV